MVAVPMMLCTATTALAVIAFRARPRDRRLLVLLRILGTLAVIVAVWLLLASAFLILVVTTGLFHD